MLGAFVQDDVIDRDVHRVIGNRRLHLVGRPDQHLRPLELLVHANDFAATFEGLTRKILPRRFLCGFFGLGHLVAHNLLVDLRPAHRAIPQYFRRFTPALRWLAGVAALVARSLSFDLIHVVASVRYSVVSPADRFFHT